MKRKQIRELRQQTAAQTKRANGPHKDKERSRRRSRMIAKLQAGRLPYTPGVMSWLTDELGKPVHRISPADVKALVRATA